MSVSPRCRSDSRLARKHRVCTRCAVDHCRLLDCPRDASAPARDTDPRVSFRIRREPPSRFRARRSETEGSVRSRIFTRLRRAHTPARSRRSVPVRNADTVVWGCAVALRVEDSIVDYCRRHRIRTPVCCVSTLGLPVYSARKHGLVWDGQGGTAGR